MIGWTRARLGLTAVAALSGACVKSYEPPRADQPHAILKVRRSYESVAGETLSEQVMVGEHRAFVESTPAKVARAPATNAILIHPIPSMVLVTASFTHVEQRLVTESYTEQEPHLERESYDCSTGFGADRTYRTCSRLATRYRSVTKTRLVNKAVTVPDGACGASVRIAPKDQRVYLLQFTYHAAGSCNLTCFVQEPGREGEFQNRLCP